jgi:hypothetical protein
MCLGAALHLNFGVGSLEYGIRQTAFLSVLGREWVAKVRTRILPLKDVFGTLEIVWHFGTRTGLPVESEISNIPDITDSSLEKYLGDTRFNGAFYGRESRILFAPASCPA